MRAILLASLLLGTIGPAMASGGGGVRALSRTSLRACPAHHRLLEHYYIYGSAFAYAEKIEVACLRTPAHAAWVFLAAAACDDTRRCKIGQLAHPAEHDAHDPRPDASPAVMTYVTSRSSLGEDCALSRRRERIAWSCKVYRPSRLALRFTTTGATTMIDDREDGAANLPLETTQPAAAYTAEP